MARFLKILIRSVGTIAGLWSLLVVVRLPSMIRVLQDVGQGFGMIFLSMQVLIAAYMMWVCYLTWFRFSPQAVQQCCGLLGFIALVVASAVLRIGSDGSPSGWWPLGMLVALFAVLWGYRRVSRLFNRVIFGETEPVVVVEVA